MFVSGTTIDKGGRRRLHSSMRSVRPSLGGVATLPSTSPISEMKHTWCLITTHFSIVLECAYVADRATCPLLPTCQYQTEQKSTQGQTIYDTYLHREWYLLYIGVPV